MQPTVSKNDGKIFLPKKIGSMDRQKCIIFITMKRALSVFLFALVFAACGDDSSTSANSSSSSNDSDKVGEPAEPAEVTVGSMTDSRDGQIYKTVQIGSQTWMAQNLNYETADSYCYNDTASNCVKYGRYYTWAAAVGQSEFACGYLHNCSLPSGNIQGVCPKGWHLPNNEEWEALLSFVDDSTPDKFIPINVVYSNAGYVLKSSSGWDSDGNGTDAFSFSALPAGGMRKLGEYYEVGDEATFWSSTEYNGVDAFAVSLFNYNNNAILKVNSKSSGASVRCLKD